MLKNIPLKSNLPLAIFKYKMPYNSITRIKNTNSYGEYYSGDDVYDIEPDISFSAFMPDYICYLQQGNITQQTKLKLPRFHGIYNKRLYDVDRIGRKISISCSSGYSNMKSFKTNNFYKLKYYK